MAFSLIGPRTGGSARLRHPTVKSFPAFFARRCRPGLVPAVLGPDADNKLEIAMTQENNELVLDRLLDAPRDKVFRCWTDPELIKQWFAPKPYTVPEAKVDLRVGGCNMI